MKRGGWLRRLTPLEARTRLRPVSVKRLRERPIRATVRSLVIERDGSGCYAGQVINRRRATAITSGWPMTCAGILDVHEVIPRSAWPGGHLVVSNCRLVCRKHHDWIDAHEITAATLGLHGYSWERPGNMPGNMP